MPACRAGLRAGKERAKELGKLESWKVAKGRPSFLRTVDNALPGALRGAGDIVEAGGAVPMVVTRFQDRPVDA